jgi:8-oxo-dGTP pyrophosphatase MutT (NUDIX family)
MDLEKKSLNKKQKIIKFLNPVLFPLVKIYWKIFKPVTYGVKVIVENNGKFLFVRNSYGYKRWTFPGGKINKGEKPEESAIREVKEETGLDVINLVLIGNIISDIEGKKDNIFIYKAKSTTDKLKLDNFEIEEGEWFVPDLIPRLGRVADRIWSIFVS